MAALSTDLVKNILMVIIVLIIIYTVLADTATDVGTAADNVAEASNASGDCVSGGTCPADILPLTSFMKKKGVVLLALMAGIVIVIITAVLKSGKK